MHVNAADRDDAYSQTCVAPGDVNPPTMDYS
jgi:hypothetical protein